MNLKTLGALEACVNHTAASITEQSNRKRLDARALASASFSQLIEAIELEIQEAVDNAVNRNKQD